MRQKSISIRYIYYWTVQIDLQCSTFEKGWCQTSSGRYNNRNTDIHLRVGSVVASIQSNKEFLWTRLQSIYRDLEHHCSWGRTCVQVFSTCPNPIYDIAPVPCRSICVDYSGNQLWLHMYRVCAIHTSCRNRKASGKFNYWIYTIKSGLHPKVWSTVVSWFGHLRLSNTEYICWSVKHTVSGSVCVLVDMLSLAPETWIYFR